VHRPAVIIESFLGIIGLKNQKKGSGYINRLAGE